MSSGALRRLISASGEQPVVADRCDLCGAELVDEHRHIYDRREQQLVCSCRECALLFGKEAAAQGRFCLVPQRRVRLEPVPVDVLGVPVGLAYFVPRADGVVQAHYPSPLGPARWEVDPGSWRAVEAGQHALRSLTPDVEALLVNTTSGAKQHWIVPVDDCFRLVALVRREWRGISGGTTVWSEIRKFFAELTEQEWGSHGTHSSR
ncbi:DUF5947 family protein [Saccharopolyspora rectivirgula]|uniref:DUF5947 family protein n=1 Tax=Saccharopolyspora rectivirgula TaxID=28042 RepID=UPI00041E84B6|nr:DUF5947 family protein [Saccharopolyspora rectivirgula]